MSKGATKMSQQQESEEEAVDSQPAIYPPFPPPRLLFQGPENAKKGKAFQVSWDFWRKRGGRGKKST